MMSSTVLRVSSKTLQLFYVLLPWKGLRTFNLIMKLLIRSARRQKSTYWAFITQDTC